MHTANNDNSNNNGRSKQTNKNKKNSDYSGKCDNYTSEISRTVVQEIRHVTLLTTTATIITRKQHQQ